MSVKADPVDPIAEFGVIFARAGEAKQGGDPSACALATVGEDGSPSVRMVLLKKYDHDGFVFYTNYNSRKAGDLEAHPRAALCFYWQAIGQQVRIEGSTERVSALESDAYFASRGRLSRLGAWASKQSRPMESPTDLMKRLAKFELQYTLGAIPRPPFWGGYRVTPDRIEFWSDRPHRMHDRRLYQRSADSWEMERLYP